MIRNMASLIDKKESIYSLRKTFEFIQSHQLYPNGQLLYTTLVLNINLNKTQISGEPFLRKDSTNSVTGYIGSIAGTNLTMYVPTKCSRIFTAYTVEFSNIIQVASSSVLVYYKEYLRYMESLHPLNEEAQIKAENILSKIRGEKESAQSAPEFLVRLIFHGVKSRAFLLSDLSLVRNLFIVSDYIILPLYVIGGYTFYASCINGNSLSEDLKEVDKNPPSISPEAKELNLGGEIYV